MGSPAAAKACSCVAVQCGLESHSERVGRGSNCALATHRRCAHFECRAATHRPDLLGRSSQSFETEVFKMSRRPSTLPPPISTPAVLSAGLTLALLLLLVLPGCDDAPGEAPPAESLQRLADQIGGSSAPAATAGDHAAHVAAVSPSPTGMNMAERDQKTGEAEAPSSEPVALPADGGMMGGGKGMGGGMMGGGKGMGGGMGGGGKGMGGGMMGGGKGMGGGMGGDGMTAGEPGGMDMDAPPEPQTADGNGGQTSTAEAASASDLSVFLPASSELVQSGAADFFLEGDHLELSPSQRRALELIEKDHGENDDRLRAQLEAREEDLAQALAEVGFDRSDVVTAVEAVEKLQTRRRLAYLDAIMDALETLTQQQRDRLSGSPRDPSEDSAEMGSKPPRPTRRRRQRNAP